MINPKDEPMVCVSWEDNLIIQMVDAYPKGKLQQQLDRIEKKLDDLVQSLGSNL